MTRSKSIALLVAALLAGPSAIAADINDGLIAWYPFDDGVVDKMGNFEMQDLMVPPTVAGKFGGAIKLDGDTFIALPIDLGPDVMPSMTISLWVKTDPRPTDAELERSLANSVYVVSESIAVGNLKNDSPYFFGEALGSAIVGPKHNTRRGQWQHVAMVRTIEDRPNTEGEIEPHVVSQFHSGGRMSESVVPFRGQSMATDLYLGTNSPRHPKFRGAVDELRIYDRALNKDEIGLLAKAKASSFPGDNFDNPDVAFPGDNFDSPTETFPGDNFGGGETDFPGDNSEPPTTAFPGDNFDPPAEAFPGDNFGGGETDFPGDNFDAPQETPPSDAATTDTSPLDNVNFGELSTGDMAVDNPADDNRDAATPASTFPAAGGSPTVMPSNENLDAFRKNMDDPGLQDSLTAVDWNVKGMLPLTQKEKANIYPGSTVTVKIRVDKDDPANKIPDVKLAIKGAQSRAESVPLRVMTSEQVPTARREIPMTIAIPADFVFEQEGQVGVYFVDTWLLAADGRPLQDNVADNNSRRLSIPIQRLSTGQDCGGAMDNSDGTRTSSACLEGAANEQTDLSALGFNVQVHTDISGFAGDFSESVSFYEDQAILRGVFTSERADRPCKVTVVATDLATGDALPHAAVDECDGNSRSKAGGNIIPPLPNRSDSVGITGIQVCKSFQNKRVKGIRVWERRINADGSLQSSETSEKLIDRPNCLNNWKQEVRCEHGAVATGAILHFKEGLTSNPFLIGVQLSCSEIRPLET